jgi:hypothetical protein
MGSSVVADTLPKVKMLESHQVGLSRSRYTEVFTTSVRTKPTLSGESCDINPQHRAYLSPAFPGRNIHGNALIFNIVVHLLYDRKLIG